MLNALSKFESPEERIEGVVFKPLKTFADDRGFFREIVRKTDPFFFEGFGQWSHSKMARNTVKAWHFHHRQIDWWYVALGAIHTVLFDRREESPTFNRKIELILGDDETVPDAAQMVVRIPPGVLHGCKTISDTAHLFYITSSIYDPADEGRYPFDSELVPHSWGPADKLIVSDNDRRVIIPPHPRIQLAG